MDSSENIYPEDYTLIPEQDRVQLPPIGAQQNSRDPMVHTKLFCPWGAATWWITEYDGKDLLFGFAFLFDEYSAELGYMSKEDLESITMAGLRIERDVNFEPKRLSEALRDHGLNRSADSFAPKLPDPLSGSTEGDDND